MRKLWRRISVLLNRKRLESELAEEMETHREMMSPDHRKEFGSALRLQEDSRDAWSWVWLEQLLQDLSYGVRVLAHAPGFTLGAIAVLSLGVGVNLAEFEIFDAMIFHRLTIRDAESVVQFWRDSKQGRHGGFPNAAVDIYRAEGKSFAWLVSEDSSFNVQVDSDSDLRSCLVSSNYFSSVGIAPAWGRLLDERDWQPGAPASTVLGYQYWQTKYGGDPNIIGTIIHVNRIPVQIVGVLSYSYDGLASRRTSLWLPVSLRPSLFVGTPALSQDFSRPSEALFGRLKPGISQAAADAELTSLTRELIRTHPRSFHEGERVQGQQVQLSFFTAMTRMPPVAIFVVMILLVFLSACANLGNMLLARGLARQREISIRMAIGASRARVIRQLMTEYCLLAILGTIAGVAFGAVASRVTMNALGAPPTIKLVLRWHILAAGIILTFLSALSFGLPAALRSVRMNSRRVHLRQSLVAVQVAVSCLLLIASGVLAHNGIVSASINIAIDYPNMLIVYPQLYARNLPPAVVNQKLDSITSRLTSIPGVEGVTAAVIPPFSSRIRIDTPQGLPRVYRNSVAPDYFAVTNLAIVLGRTFSPGELDPIVVSESAARAVWPNQNPMGKIWELAGAKRTVVGVVKDSGVNLLAETDSIEAYVPIQDAEAERSALILHTRTDPAALMRTISAASAADGETVSVQLMRTGRDQFLEAQRRMVTLIGSIGTVATALAAAGMFALVAFAVAQRKRELGIRIAIGARGRHILQVLLAQNARPTWIGLIIGIILALVLSRLVRSFVVMPKSYAPDFAGFALGVICFIVVAALATLSPATRALRIDPATTLRED